MTPTQLAALHKAGVWPEGTADRLIYHTLTPPVYADALLINAMLDALPDEWIMYRRTVCGAGRMNPDTGKCEPAVRVWCVKDRLASISRADGLAFEDADKFQALFSALVAAGIVKETP